MIPKTYEHLNANERDLLAVLKSKDKSLREIAEILKRSPSTLSRELKRNTPPVYTGYYLSHKAQERADRRNHESHRRPRLKRDSIRHYVEKRLRLGWSPELIAGRLALKHPGLSISHEAIYPWIYHEAPHLILSLVRAHRRKRKHRGYSRKHKKNPTPPNRPLGNGHHQLSQKLPAVQVTVERKARYTKLAKLNTKTSRAMSVALIRRLSRYPTPLRWSITYDNGPENAEHMRTNKALGTCSYFCEPFHSYERGTVENTIGLVRRFLPKKTNLAKISQVHLSKIENWLNHRPRKCLGFKTPAEVFKAACCT